MTPTIIFVPGLWVGPKPFAALAEHFSRLNIKTETARLVSTGTTSPGNPSMKDDVAAVRKHIESVVDRDEDVVLVLHSAGGFIGGGAANRLTKKQRGGQAGIVHAVFLSGAVFPAGLEHKPLPFAVYKETCAATAGSRTERIAAGHMPMLSKPGEIASILEAILASV